MSSITETLAEYYLNLKVENIAKEVITKTEHLILDYLGCVIGGANLDSSKMIKKCFMNQNDSEGCTVVLSGKAPCEKAAFINAAFSHGLEMDDLNYGAGGHPAVSIMPAAFAMAEKVKAGGLDLLIALITGYDLMYRIGEAANPDSQFKRGLHPTSINGTFGAAMAAASLLKLNKTQIMNAIGIAGSFTSGNLECYADGSLTKRINPGVAAQGGIMSALLAAEGYTGPRWIFEGRSGFLVSYSGAPDSTRLTENMDYSCNGIMKTSFKPYANCRYNHSSIYAALKLLNQHKIDYRDITAVDVKVIEMALRGVCEPRDVKYNPKNIVDAQFSLPYSISVALIKGKAFIEEYASEMLYNPEVRGLMSKVTMEHSPELDKMVSQNAFPSEVYIRLKNGKEYYQRVDYCKGDPEEPLTENELIEKYTSLAKINISDNKRIQKIAGTVRKLDQIPAYNLIALLG